ncbi:SCO7613 C-terminal domain-containing membrane protein [Protaetiibacter mangrovi]|uniref:DUF2157 domain-containing protein n=1 Tax=Protaetiibacter mangrovi TaxID=2970926 RepID=A0ABT1ZBK1_9MICO|nr:hypothetical protein [Protaetiibacter mangrovi]MCS0498082.1 hypothetical protein [Protaetiibacter mangrovi]
MSWTDDVARFVLDTAACPRCHTRTWEGGAAMRLGVCARCGADLRGEAGSALWAASEAVVDAVRHREALIDALPTAGIAAASAAPPAQTAPAAAPHVAPPVGAPGVPVERVATPASDRPRSAISLQSVLAVVGAGLLAVAAIVFTFLNPDLTDFGTRTTIIAVVTALFLGGAWLLHSRRLQFSAEAIGALGMVFLALDVWAFSRVAPPDVSGWFFGALGLLVSGGAMVAVGARMRMRTWLWSGLVGLAIVPAFLGYGFASAPEVLSAGWIVAWGHVAVVFSGWALLELTRPLRDRLGSPLLADRVSLTVLQLAAVLSAIPLALVFAGRLLPDAPGYLIGALFAVLALGALLTTRVIAPELWTLGGGVLASAALVAVAAAVPLPREEWTFLAVAVAAALPLVAVSLIPRTGPIRRRTLEFAVVGVTLVVALPSFFALGAASVFALDRAWSADETITLDADTAVRAAITSAALVVTALGVWALARASLEPGRARALAVLARWILVPAAAGLPLAFPAHLALTTGYALAVSAAASLALLFVDRVRRSALSLRAPLVTVAYGAIVEAVLLSWPDAALAAIGGAAAVAMLGLAARTAPARIRPLHTTIGFAYLLVAGAAALSLTELELLPVLCLLTSGAAVVAIAASLTSWLPTGSWYAVLGVTAVPFGIGVVSVLIERSGWTALSSGVIFLLAVTLMLTRRAGAGRVLRAGAAALLVPTLAVVVVCLAAQLLTVSGSPYALVVIAAIVAIALPTTGLVRGALVRAGYPVATADAVRLAIEASSLVTGAIAVVLALVRAAAGFDIAFVVLLVLGIGSAATALWMRRRYGWWTAAAAWTGALWCAWAIAGVAVVEPYVLPPAEAAIVVGAVLTARRRGDAGQPAAALFTTGLGVALAPSLALLAVTGNGTGTSFAPSDELWRAYALMASGVLLTVAAGLVTRPVGTRATRFEPLRWPLLLGAVLAASAGMIQGARLGWELDPLPIAGTPAMLQVLGFAVVAAATAAAAGRLAVVAGLQTRWVYVPVSVFLVVGPMTAIEDDPLSIWTLWGLELLLLAVMVATVWRAREREVRMPPVWLQWSLAWAVAVTAWSQREILRVEGFSLPLGLALVAVGVLAFARGARPGDVRTPTSWPIGFRGSWATLAPGIVATLLPSIMATFTDPQTWRAILVIAFALVAVLFGARKTLAAPFILGISVLPLEILVVFLVQLGDTINPLLWWITLATAGIVLLVIAVGWERRTGADASLTARIRDLR